MAGWWRFAAESEAAGSEFVVRLPLLVDVSAGTTPEIHVAEAPPVSPPAERRRRILVADDNVDLATSMGSCSSSWATTSRDARRNGRGRR
jgi:hypothetical protein